MFVGLPGSGKSYLARQMSKELGIAHISSERIRYELFENPSFTKEEDGVVKNICMLMAEQFLAAGLSAVYDASINRLADRRQLRDFARSHSATPLLIWQQIDTSSSFARSRSRNPKNSPDDKYVGSLSKEMYEGLAKTLQIPKNEEVIVVSGKHSYKAQFQTIARELFQQQLLLENSPVMKKVPYPGLVNLVSQNSGRVDHSRRNISIQ